ncbi:MAG: substrate-binding domain-containing protein, partial [Reichenbachiella sp.]
MRKIAIITLLLFMALGTAISQPQKVGLLFDQFGSSRWPQDAKFLEAEFAKYGIETSSKIAHSDFDKQMTQGQEFIDEGVSAIIVITVDGSRPHSFIKNAKEKGILIVAYDRLIIDSQLDLYVSYDAFEIGRIQAQRTIESVKTGNIMMINGPVTDINGIEFRRGQLDVLTPEVESGNIKIVHDIIMDSWSDAIALMALYETNPDFSQIQGIVSVLDLFVDAMIEYKGEEDFLKNIYVTGQDPTPLVVDRLKNDVQNMSILKPLQPLAQKTVELTMAKL